MALRNRKSFENKMQTKDPKTLVGYGYTLDSFEGFMKKNNLNINTKNAEDIVQNYVNWFSKTHSPVTVSNYYSRIKKYLRHLKIQIEEIELPKIPEKELYPLKLADIHRIFEVLPYKDVTLFLTQLQGGLRIGETVQLRKKHFVLDYTRIIIKIPPQIAKFKRGRTVVVGKEAGDRIQRLLKKIGDDDLVFGTGHNPISSRVNKEDILRRALIKVGLDMKYDDTGRYQINTHSFRAYFITRVSRHDPNIAKKLAGEKGYLLQYDRLTDEEYIENYCKFEEDLTVFDLTRRDHKQNSKQIELEERLAKQEKQIKELMDYAFKKIE
jgi:integrase